RQARGSSEWEWRALGRRWDAATRRDVRCAVRASSVCQGGDAEEGSYGTSEEAAREGLARSAFVLLREPGRCRKGGAPPRPTPVGEEALLPASRVLVTVRDIHVFSGRSSRLSSCPYDRDRP